jgi:tetratricopeptide (TPR) repeat protein/ribosomal protein L40E
MKCPACKKNIPDESLKCPICNTITSIACPNCNTINPIGNLHCKNCSAELLKICSHCGGVNFPDSEKCRKCGTPFIIKKKELSGQKPAYLPNLIGFEQAFEILKDGIESKDKRFFSITGEKGIGKTYLLKKIITSLKDSKYQWCIGKCTPLTQLSPGGVIQDMLLNLFKLPNYNIHSQNLNDDAEKFFTNEFKFLKPNEISEFINFIYNFQDGNYEDIIINKKRIYDILNRVFEALCSTGKFIFVVDNLEFIDGFSIEFLTNFITNEHNQKYLKFIAIYNEHKPIKAYFLIDDNLNEKTIDIHLAPAKTSELEQSMKYSTEAGTYVSKREKEIIFNRCNGIPAFVEQAVAYCFDCQISDKAFLMPKDFSTLIKERLQTLNKINNEAYKLLCGAAILGDRLNLGILKEIFGYKNKEFNDIMSYLVKSSFIRPYNELFYEFNNLLLWETILRNIQNDSCFEEINIKIGKALSVFNLNTNATMAMIAHNLKENRMAFDIWTKTTRLASHIGDINLYVIAQKQCLALLNEFNENETVNIRYNISERLGKLLTEYNPEEAIEFLPDAIANARTNNNETKEIELLGYLAKCCKKTGNYFGDIECVDNVLKRLTPSQELEYAMIKSTKLSSLLCIGNCGEVIDIIDNEILSVLNTHLQKPKLNTNIPLGYIYETRIKVHLYLAVALALQGNDRAFSVLAELFNIIDKHNFTNFDLIGKAKLTLAFANTMKGNFQTSEEILNGLSTFWHLDSINLDNISSSMSENISIYNLIWAINKFMLKDYENLRQDLCDAAIFAQNTGLEFHKNLFKTLLGKLICDSQQAKRALEIYNNQVNYFADKKLAFGALLCWYLISEATIIIEAPKKAIEILSQALDIAKNPKISNLFFIALLNVQLAKAYIILSDYTTAKIHLETALTISKKYSMNDITSKIYLEYGYYYREIGTIASQNQIEYLKGAIKMYDRALEIVLKTTKSVYMKEIILSAKNDIDTYCKNNGYSIN